MNREAGKGEQVAVAAQNFFGIVTLIGMDVLGDQHGGQGKRRSRRISRATLVSETQKGTKKLLGTLL
jgi:hypothetical protein